MPDFGEQPGSILHYRAPDIPSPSEPPPWQAHGTNVCGGTFYPSGVDLRKAETEKLSLTDHRRWFSEFSGWNSQKLVPRAQGLPARRLHLSGNGLWGSDPRTANAGAIRILIGHQLFQAVTILQRGRGDITHDNRAFAVKSDRPTAKKRSEAGLATVSVLSVHFSASRGRLRLT
jgi:hypothetical protein